MIGQRCRTTPAGIKIGIAYEPPRLYWSDPDAERLQAALLHKPKPSRRWVFSFWRVKQ